MTQEPPPCKPCQIAREFPEYRMFNPACLYCGARLIQRHGAKRISPQEVTALRKATLADWLQHGHSEAQIRALVKGPLAVRPNR